MASSPWDRRSSSAMRFGSPVSGSCRAWCARAFSALIWAVTSREMPNVPMIRPLSSRSGIFVLDTQASAWPPWVSCSSFPMIGSPVRMICCSSSKAAAAWSSPKKAKSVFPISSAALWSGAYAATQPALTKRNRLCRSLKYTRSAVQDSRLLMHVSSSSRDDPLSPRPGGGSSASPLARRRIRCDFSCFIPPESNLSPCRYLRSRRPLNELSATVGRRIDAGQKTRSAVPAADHGHATAGGRRRARPRCTAPACHDRQDAP